MIRGLLYIYLSLGALFTYFGSRDQPFFYTLSNYNKFKLCLKLVLFWPVYWAMASYLKKKTRAILKERTGITDDDELDAWILSEIERAES